MKWLWSEIAATWAAALIALAAATVATVQAWLARSSAKKAEKALEGINQHQGEHVRLVARQVEMQEREAAEKKRTFERDAWEQGAQLSVLSEGGVVLFRNDAGSNAEGVHIRYTLNGTSGKIVAPKDVLGSRSEAWSVPLPAELRGLPDAFTFEGSLHWASRRCRFRAPLHDARVVVAPDGTRHLHFRASWKDADVWS